MPRSHGQMISVLEIFVEVNEEPFQIIITFISLNFKRTKHYL